MKITCITTGTVQTWLHLLALPKLAEKLRIEVPVNTFLIEHNDLKIIFDAGQLPISGQDPQANYFFKVSPQETLKNQLAQLDIIPEAIDYIVLSHLHGDHCDGLPDFPETPVIAQRAAVERLTAKYSNPVIAADGEFDVAGDGKIICLPTPGHAPCHQSLLIKSSSGNTLLTGDAVYFPEALDYEPSPEEYSQRQDFFDSLQKIRDLRNKNTNIFYSHYPYRHLI